MGAKIKALAEKALKEAAQTTDNWKSKGDKMAQVVADKCTEMPGRETSASQVKKMAQIAAGAVTVSIAMAVAYTSCGRGGHCNWRRLGKRF